MAMSTGRSSFLSLRSAFAPVAKSISTIGRLPWKAACARGVTELASARLTSALALISTFAISPEGSAEMAHSSGDTPFMSPRLTLAPWATSTLTASRWPDLDAIHRGGCPPRRICSVHATYEILPTKEAARVPPQTRGKESEDNNPIDGSTQTLLKLSWRRKGSERVNRGETSLTV
eukprot:scaffold59036_cov29-Prasinocladus_malaysianus.AAC.2